MATNHTTEEIIQKAQGNWDEILTEAGIPSAFLTKKHMACPICGGKDRFRYADTNGTGKYYCSHHGNGYGIHLLNDHLGDDWAETYKFLEDFLWCGTYSPKAYTGTISSYLELSEEEVSKRKEALGNTWKRGVRISKNDRYDRYLKSRGIDLPASDFALIGQVTRLIKELGYGQFVYDAKTKTSKSRFYGSYPTVITMLVQGNTESGEYKAINLHRNYLSKTDDGKAVILDDANLDDKGQPTPLATRKVMKASIPSMSGCFIPLFPATGSKKLGVGEGIETMLAVRVLARQENVELPVWPTYSADMLAGLILPVNVANTLEELHIFADHDKVDVRNGQRKGIHCAEKLKERINAQYPHIKVFIHIPETEGDDFNDCLIKGERIKL